MTGDPLTFLIGAEIGGPMGEEAIEERASVEGLLLENMLLNLPALAGFSPSPFVCMGGKGGALDSGGPSDRKSMRSRVLEEVVGVADLGCMGGGPNEISSPSTSMISSKSKLSRFLAGPRTGRLRLGMPSDPIKSLPFEGAGRRDKEYADGPVVFIGLPSEVLRKRAALA